MAASSRKDLTFGVLERSDDPFVPTLLEVALYEPDSDIQQRAIRCMIRREERDVVLKSAQVFDRLSPAAKAVAVREIPEPLHVLLGLMRSREVGLRRNVISWVETAADPRLADLLLTALQDDDPGIREDAARILDRIAEKVVGGKRPVPGRDILNQALHMALANFRIHRQAFLLETMLRFDVSFVFLFVQILENPTDTRRPEIHRLLRKTHRPEVHAILFRMLRHDDERLVDLAREVYRLRQDPGFLHGLGTYLAGLTEKSRVTLARGLVAIPWWGEGFLRSDPEVQLQTLALVRHLRYGRDERIAMLRDLWSSPHEPVIREALGQLVAMGGDLPADVIEPLLDHPSERIQRNLVDRIAESRWSSRIRLLIRAMNSPHESVRNAARNILLKEGFDRYLAKMPHLDEETRRIAAKAMQKVDGHIAERLRRELRTVDPERKVSALRILDTIDDKVDLAPILVPLLSDPDERVRATVIRSLAARRGREVEGILVRTLRDPDPRVRANTIEAFGMIGAPATGERILPFLEDPNNRIRANAVRVLCDLGDPRGILVLDGMVRHESPAMRRSVVWVLEGVDIKQRKGWLDRLATDREPAVREAADRLLARLEQEGGAQ